MDGMPIYYSSHMQGLYSVFNSDAVKGLTVYKGGVPARFGGRGASVLDVKMRDGNIEQFQGSVSAGLITSKFSLEAPIIKDKFSLFLSGRSTRLSGGSLYDSINDGTQTGGRLNSDKGRGGKSSGGKGKELVAVIFDFLHLMKVGLISMGRSYIILMKSKIKFVFLYRKR